MTRSPVDEHSSEPGCAAYAGVMTHLDNHGSVPPEAQNALPPRGMPTAPSAMGGMGSTGPIRVVDLATLNAELNNGDESADQDAENA